ncbi:hypothetical protein [Paenibacillus sp. FSL R5-0912]|uniref:hypothetical protein n=1 Tax=Paenibacillus sp. FSL R5-0912 TaxID=1536771 RepID=UPI000694F032|nr:hypothetical protein [Paenibacillus sp. FSL R5-0912]
MKNELIAQFPQWCNNKEHGKFNLCMSDDLDSLFSCAILNQLFGYEVKYFYDFNSIYSTEHIHKPTVCVDIAVEQGMTWDNHVVKIMPNDKVNTESANINAINGINRRNYFTKYAGSTLLQIISYYNIPIPKSREARLILLTIDSSYMGHYSKDFKDTHSRYMEQLELYDLIDTLEHETSTQAYYDVKRKFNLNGKILVNNGHLETTIDLAAMQGLFDVDLKLSEESFKKSYAFENRGRHSAIGISKPSVFSFALTGKNEFKYTTAGHKVD